MNNKILEKFNNWILTIDSWIKWWTITIVACTHWDEVVWIEVLRYLLEKLDIKNNILKWKINLIIWNLRWYKEWKKFIDTDFNRVWGFEDTLENTYEYKRAKEIKNMIWESDYILDIHATTNPSPSFIIPIWIDSDLIKAFNVKYIIKNILWFLHWLPLIGYVKKQNSNIKWFVIEAGQVWDNDTTDLAISNTLTFLEFYWFIEWKWFNIFNKKIFKLDKCLYANTMDISFKYTKNTPKSFQKINKWSYIYVDWDNFIYSGNDYYSLMPTLPRYIWEEILYLMTLEE